MNFKDIKFQYYKNDVSSSSAVGFISLDKFIDAIKNPKEKTKQLLKQIEEASRNNDMNLKSSLKKGLFAFTPDVIVKNKRTYDDVIQYTGMAVLDFDKIDNSVKFKEFLFNEYKCIIACWLSPSKKGVKALVKIPTVKTKEEFKSYSWGLSAEFEKYIGFDIAVNNAVLLLFIGHDENILFRSEPETWIKKGIQINSFDLSKVKDFKPSDKITDKQSLWVVNWFQNGINSIYDNGHPTLRAYCVALGGYVAGGFISFFDAVSMAESLISQNSYLQKGISGYQKTARQAIKLGTLKPLKFD